VLYSDSDPRYRKIYKYISEFKGVHTVYCNFFSFTEAFRTKNSCSKKKLVQQLWKVEFEYDLKSRI
jgi:hypothetical protein